MILLRAFEAAVVILFLAFMICDVLIPIAKNLPLFPTLRDNQKKGAKK